MVGYKTAAVYLYFYKDGESPLTGLSVLSMAGISGPINVVSPKRKDNLAKLKTRNHVFNELSAVTDLYV